MTYRLGLTGSIGMGKSTTAQMFAEQGCAVWDADAAVHALYGPDGAGTREIAAHFPFAVGPNGVDRAALKQIISKDPDALGQIEGLIHPLVVADRARFAKDSAADITVFDIPLLYETGADGEMDSVAVVTTDAAEQRARVLARPGMTEETFAMILARQMSDSDKRARADHIIRTDTMKTAQDGVADIVSTIREQLNA